MRIFTIRSGKYAGEHRIYNTVQEAKDSGIVKIISPWYEANTGDWVISDDGYVIQCLNKFKLVNKRHRSGQYTDSFRFPNGTFYVYYDRKGDKQIKNFYAAITNNQKSSLGNTSRLGRFMTTRKKLWVTYVAGGLSPFMAYIKAYNKGYTNNVVGQVNKLLDDPLVRKHLMEELRPFVTEVEEKIKQHTGSKDLTDFLTDQIMLLLINENPSMKDRRENIKLMVSLFGEHLGLIKSKKSIKEIEDAEYKVVAPPALGESSMDQ